MKSVFEKEHQLNAMPNAWKKPSNIFFVVLLSLVGISIFIFLSPMVLLGFSFNGWGIFGHVKTILSYALPAPFGALFILRVILGLN